MFSKKTNQQDILHWKTRHVKSVVKGDTFVLLTEFGMREKKNEWVTANEQIWWCDKQIICKYEETFRHTKKDKNKNASCLEGCTETHQSVLHTKAKTI